MNKLALSSAIGFLSLSSFFAACKKIDFDGLKNICRIETMNTITGDAIAPRHFFYDQWKNPTMILFDDPGTGKADFHFYYDSQHRLTGYRGYSSHNYKYDHRGLAVLDTIHDNYVGLDIWTEEKLYYDNQRRIVKTVTTMFKSADPDQPGLHETETVFYNYDGNGNLIRPGVVYDNKTGLLRTHPVWMLIHKDYSMNNPVMGEPIVYNDYGLPVNPQTIFLNHFSGEVIYHCKPTVEGK